MMAPKAATVDLLVKKARFEPQVAMAVAEAIDHAMNDSQFVTVPVLDARLSEFRAEVRADLLRLDHKIDTRFSELDRKMDAGFAGTKVAFAEIDRKIEVAVATLDKKIGVAVADTKAELVRWVFITMAGNVVLSGGVAAILNALQHH